jgi:PAS domain S-box-containing protein
VLKKTYYFNAFSSKTIVRDALVWLVAMVIVVVAVAELGYYQYSGYMAERMVQQRADTLISEISSLLTVPLYNRDLESVSHIYRIYSQMPDLGGIRISDEQGLSLVDSIDKDSSDFLKKSPILKGTLHLGNVTLALSCNNINRNRRQTQVVIFCVGLALIGAIVLGIHVVMRYILIEPLQKFNEGLSEIANGNYSTRLQEVPHTDLNSSVEAVNLMAERIEKFVGELKETKYFLQDVLNSMPSIMIGVDRFCRITNLNHEAVKSSGRSYKECLGKPVADIFPSLERRVRNNILDSIVKRSLVTVEQNNCQILGDKRSAEITVYPLCGETVDGAVIRVDDITSRVKLQEVMIQTEKMISVGGLGAGMAHEINNPLGGILQATQNIEIRLSADLEKNVEVARACNIEFDDLQRYLTQRNIFSMLTGIRDAGQRAAQIVQNMLQFSRRNDSERQDCVVGQLIDRVLELANNDFDIRRKYDFRNVTVIRNYRYDIEVKCSRTEIEQVFLNLCKNAAQAYEPVGSSKQEAPEITITVLDDEEYVTVEVADNGNGMTEEVKNRIFEPFFTTKGVGEGTGLGLAVSFFIVVEQHNGQLTVDSRPGQGATFTVKLPKV